MPDPQAVFSDLQAACGVKLFTVTTCDADAQLFRRAYTSHPVDYPVSGTKPGSTDDWSRQVIDGKRSFLANSTDGFSRLFPDHALINALGCQSVMNIPVLRRDGAVVGTINLLDIAGFFTPDRVRRFESLVAARRDDLAGAMAAVAG